MGAFKKATRQKLKLRAALDGPSGSGKTYSGLRFAFALAQHEAAKRGDPASARVAVIDTEMGSASKYLGSAPDGLPWQFDVAELTSFAPTAYAAVIAEAGRAGYDVLLIDSLSHAWEGKDGALELVDRKSNGGGNSFTAWKDVTPMHRAMIDAILQSPIHVICTMRSKTEYVLEEQVSRSGKKIQVPRKVGMAPVQRAGMEYEFDVYASMDWSHQLTVGKTRCEAIDGFTAVKPGPEFLLPVIEWLEGGVRTPPAENAPAFAPQAPPPTSPNPPPAADDDPYGPPLQPAHKEWLRKALSAPEMAEYTTYLRKEVVGVDQFQQMPDKLFPLVEYVVMNVGLLPQLRQWHRDHLKGDKLSNLPGDEIEPLTKKILRR